AQEGTVAGRCAPDIAPDYSNTTRAFVALLANYGFGWVVAARGGHAPLVVTPAEAAVSRGKGARHSPELPASSRMTNWRALRRLSCQNHNLFDQIVILHPFFCPSHLQ
ncbi:hypothetical protein, partial [Rhizorhabdus argentea]|uniref:hypothetical protein n=1 Tax=Rhizorhabdus argentea TaxID=1387174 RepID=UPI0030EEA61D